MRLGKFQVLAIAGNLAARRQQDRRQSSRIAVLGTELGFVGWFLGFNLIVASEAVRCCALAVAAGSALLFLFYAPHEIRSLTAQPDGHPKATTLKSSFML